MLAPSFVAIDAATGRVLAARGATIRRPIASLTKVMTALVVIERGDLEGRVVVTPAATRVEPYNEGLVPGRAYTRETLLWSALLAVEQRLRHGARDRRGRRLARPASTRSRTRRRVRSG